MIYLGGDGTFSPQGTSMGTGFPPECVVVTDFNGDGKPDIVVANQGSVSVLTNSTTHHKTIRQCEDLWMCRLSVPALQLLLLFSAHPSFAREVAITIDDLPRGGDAHLSAPVDRAMTVKLLRPFRQGHIPLIGFVNECHHTDELRALLTLWIKAGADLGNHTCSHLDLNDVSPEAFESDIVKGEPVTTAVLGHRPVYFRYPFLHAGKDSTNKQAVQDFLRKQSYRNAPVTLDNSDYMFAALYAKDLASGDKRNAELLTEAYLAYMNSIFDFFEKRSVEVTGHEIRQILLMHASQLSADTMPALLALMRRRNYTFISLEQALQDPAYSLPETYVGPGGFSWIHRWSMTMGMKPKGEPDEPRWVRKEAGF